jgi:FkbM family methyltransferase
MNIDVPLAWTSRRLRSLPGLRRPIRVLREVFARRYRRRTDRWITIRDYDDGSSFRLNRASPMGSAIYWEGHYSLNEIAILKERLPRDGVFVDGGAHAGEFTLVGAKLAPEGRVIAFEPVSRVFEQLSENVRSNRYANVVTFRLALSDSKGELEMFVGDPTDPDRFDDDIVATQFCGFGRENAIERVPAVCLDQIVRDLALTRLDLIKLDIEGAELLALRGAEESIRRFRPALILEVHAPLFAAAGTSLDDLFDFIDRHRYRVSLITDYQLRDTLKARRWQRYGKLVEVSRTTIPSYANVLCDPR